MAGPALRGGGRERRVLPLPAATFLRREYQAAAHPVTQGSVRTRGRTACLALLALLCLAPAPHARAAPEEQKVWRALTEGEPRSSSPAAVSRAATAPPERTFPSEIVLALVVAGVLVAVGSASAFVAARRSRLSPSAVRPPAASEEGSPLERLWRLHLRSKGPKRD